MATVISCTSDFDEINTRPDALTSDDISAKFLVTDVQQKLIAQNTFGVWLGNMLHPDLFSGQSAQGFAQSAQKATCKTLRSCSTPSRWLAESRVRGIACFFFYNFYCR